MDMEVTAWHALHGTVYAQEGTRRLSRATLRRIAAFARPHRRRLVWFLVLSTVIAAGAVVTPLLAGRVVDAIVHHGSTGLVLGIAAVIAVIALAGRAWGCSPGGCRRASARG